MAVIQNAGSGFPLSAAWFDTRDVVTKTGWAVPSCPTLYRRRNALNMSERHKARFGHETPAASIPATRDKPSIAPLEWFSLDMRTQDFRVDFGDGRAMRPVMMALIDVVSIMVPG